MNDDRLMSDNERDVRSVADNQESLRQERFSEEKNDRADLRKDLGKIREEWDNPRKKPPPDSDMSLREEAGRAYDQLVAGGAQDEIDRKAFDEFLQLGKQAKRTHGVASATEAFNQLMAAEKMLRTNPHYALNWLAQSYGDGSHGQAVAQRENDAALSEVNKFYNEYDVPDGVENLIVHALESGAVPRTGDFEKDLKAAYRHAMGGRRVKSVR